MPDQTVAGSIATALVERRLAAAVHMAEIASVYRWQGAVRRGPEIVLTAKSLAARFAAVKALVDELHPYELPPLLRVDIAQTSPEYAHWIAENTDG
ncbi:divalent-cation tolerance protein CutA [Denitrobaculum tricleocarpae]|uniref:Divalent-cation tolerance protein CutA n=1 Tax=Denitrobaculum tricleocarpae TaxID=2591009 RepID=A0A545T5V6_9PROT|nr:divalent-cation tolerance protein CutA [Denitrobaculum tricleocarpae]